jgi:metal-dependent amidase/aminoacylase/carboxypeptidase family protein
LTNSRSAPAPRDRRSPVNYEEPMPIHNRIAAFHEDMTAWRRDLHQYPELALEEHRTSATIQAKLKEFGVEEIVTGMARTGVVGVIRGRKPGGAIGLRADIDAFLRKAVRDWME